MEEKEKRTVEDSSPIDVDVGTAADVEAVMKKYDRESNTKIWEGLPKQVIRYAMALFMIFMVYVSMFSSMDGSVRRCWFLGLILVFVYVMYPVKKGTVTRVNYMPWYDIVLAVLSIGTFGYQIYFLDDLIYKGSRLDTIDIIIGTLAILLLIEACRRVVGIPIIVVVVAFMAYALLGSGMEFKDLIYTLFYTTQGILGTPIQVCSTYIFLFVLFGAFLEATGIAAFFIDLANAIAGSATGGPAKVAVISSALCGMVSGSSVGNTVTTGSVTIPLMKKTGYPPQFAGAVEAAASTGGQIMPPIMGAAAFLMAEMTGESYNTIIIRAILPAFLYFAGIFIMVHFKAKSMGLKGLKRSELPKFRDIWPKFYLTGAIGTQAHEGSLFNGPGKMYSFLPQISWPIFHAGAITKNIKVQGARAEQLLAAYEQTVLTAVGEVRDALSDNVQEYERNARLKSGVDAAQAALDLANEKYANGLVDFTNVINAQSALASLSEQYVVSGGQISTNAVRLFKALGGGWKPLDEAERAIAEAAAKKK